MKEQTVSEQLLKEEERPERSGENGVTIDNLLDALNEEANQERTVEDPRSSFFDDAPSEEIIIDRAREFDDITKQYVRKEYWLKSVRKLKDDKGSGIKLLTLPGRHRMEVGLYHQENLLTVTRQGNSDVLSVVGFENNPDIFGILKVSSPYFLRLFNNDLVRTLSEPGSEAHAELIAYFPFDVVNLDLTGNLVVRAEGPYGPVLVAIRETIKLQGAQRSDWILMLTFRAGLAETDRQALESLKKEFQDNLQAHPTVKRACHNTYGCTEAEDLLTQFPEEILGQFAAKWITDQAHKADWQIKEARHICYGRSFYREEETRKFSIRKLILRLGRNRLPRYDMPAKHDPTTAWHVDDLVKVVGQRAQDVDEKLERLYTEKPAFIDALIAEIDTLKSKVDMQISGDELTC